MTIEQTGIIDIIAISPSEDTASLIISDHLDWKGDGRAHLTLVQNKINEYLSFIEGGTLFEARPDLQGKRLIIKVVGLCKLSLEAENFYEQVRDMLAKHGYPFVFEYGSD